MRYFLYVGVVQLIISLSPEGETKIANSEKSKKKR